MQQGNNFLALFTWEDESSEHMHLYSLPPLQTSVTPMGKALKPGYLVFMFEIIF